MDDILILGARRAYEYGQDEIRLSWLSNRAVIQQVQQAFAFEAGSVGQPPELFGEVPLTMPPGLVFHSGVAPFPEGTLTPVRFLTIEAKRIVIDVAGPSEVIDLSFDALIDLMSGVRTSSGEPAIPAPRTMRDYSEIRFRPDFLPSSLVAPELTEAIIDSTVELYPEASVALVPSIQFRAVANADTYPGDASAYQGSFSIDLRAGFPLEENVFYSAAPLATADHLRMLDRLCSAMTGNAKLTQSRRATPAKKRLRSEQLGA